MVSALVADGRGSAVGVDVIHLCGLELRILERVAHDAESAFAVVRGSGEMERVAAHAVSHDFGQNGRAAALGELQLFENQDARAFAHDETIAVAIERPGCVRGIVVALG